MRRRCERNRRWICASPPLTVRERRKDKEHFTPLFPCEETLYTLLSLCGKYGTGKFAKISLLDKNYVSIGHWYVFGGKGSENGYPTRSGSYRGKPAVIYLHRAIGARIGLNAHPFDNKTLIDHKNRDTFDARRSNLRVASKQQNAVNRNRTTSSKAEFIGVYRATKGGNTWRLQIGIEDEVFKLNGFRSAEEAARVRDALARYYHEEFAVTNFPGTDMIDLDTAKEQLQHRKTKRKASRFTGVTRTNGLWQARIWKSGSSISLGCFGTEEEAAQVYDNEKVRRGLKRVNFPDRLEAELLN